MHGNDLNHQGNFRLNTRNSSLMRGGHSQEQMPQGRGHGPKPGACETFGQHLLDIWLTSRLPCVESVVRFNDPCGSLLTLYILCLILWFNGCISVRT